MIASRIGVNFNIVYIWGLAGIWQTLHRLLSLPYGSVDQVPRYKALRGDVRLRVREIIRQLCRQNGVDILRGVEPQN